MTRDNHPDMGRDCTDYLDAACKKMYGHTDWAYLSTVKPKKRRDEALKEQNCRIVVFWEKPDPNGDPDEVNRELDWDLH